MSKKSKAPFAMMFLLFIYMAFTSSMQAQGEKASAALASRAGVSDREQDGLIGPVHRVRTEKAQLVTKSGKLVESPRVAAEMISYDEQGNRIDSAHFTTSDSSRTGNRIYKYDERGNIIEMTVRDKDGAILGKEIYTYEFDAAGNWTKMTTSVALIEGGKVTFEPTEVRYRTIAYYLTDAIAKKMQSAAPTTSTPAASSSAVNGERETKAVADAPTNLQDANKSIAIKETAPSSQLNSASLIQTNLAAGAGSADMPSSTVNDKGASLATDTKTKRELTSHSSPKSSEMVISGGILTGEALKLPMPIYPKEARLANVAGVVSVEVMIDVTGKVISARAISGPMQLRQAAEQAAWQARFSPTLLSGQPLKVSGVIDYNFVSPTLKPAPKKHRRPY
jgi:TonB family protein